ncbi:protein nanos isoform X1 [Drosophila tropicalis]|uniref:protein nanos isoform X1 n=1 Tax=Drosophila tropicalis TaxID=46794 RepID=UPI0035AB9A5A
MFRSSSSSLEGNAAATTTSDNFGASATGFNGGAGGNLNLLGLQDIYLDTVGGNMPLVPTPPPTPLTPESPAPFGSQAATQFPLLTDNANVNAMNAATAANTLIFQRQYHYHLLIQQQQQQLALAQHQLALAASAAAANAATNHQQKDEIARSLKIFAQLTTNSAEHAAGSMQDVMQEFALNGYVSDDINRFQSVQSPQLQQRHLTPTFTAASGSAGANMAAATANTFPMTTANWLYNYREQLNSVWRNMSYMPAATMAAVHNQMNAVQGAFSVPIQLAEPMRNPNSTKMNKRYKGKEPLQISRHCVFCENNNEPEAVIYSHTVRDSFNRVLCPKLRTYVCPICGASGDSAHTIKYCPKKPIITMEDAIKAESFRLAKSSYYNQQMKV